jgi:hypothetical protein
MEKGKQGKRERKRVREVRKGMEKGKQGKER